MHHLYVCNILSSLTYKFYFQFYLNTSIEKYNNRNVSKGVESRLDELTNILVLSHAVLK